MDQLRFKYYYPKLHHQNTAILIYAGILHIVPSDYDFIEYDCKYIYNIYGDYSYYDVPAPPMLFLVFVGNKGIPFTTMRKYNDENKE